ncbi:MAG: hypothetical protein U5O39_01285 [Gammaproteobacteria bacterium]|nr:hypothetical protein [Gammaproteobacteria bacterium]
MKQIAADAPIHTLFGSSTDLLPAAAAIARYLIGLVFMVNACRVFGLFSDVVADVVAG